MTITLDTEKPTESTGKEYSRKDLPAAVLSLLADRGEMSITGISEALGYTMPPSNLRATIRMLISEGDLEYAHPESLRHPRQRIRLANRPLN